MDEQIIAVFDFDGTLTIGAPSRLLFLKQLVGVPRLVGGLLSRYYNNSLLGKPVGNADYLDHLFLKGITKQELEQQAAVFLRQVLIKKLRKEAIERLHFHQQQGHTCIVVSGGWDIYLKPWAEEYEIKQLICTELEFDPVHHQSTGQMLHNYCIGSEKLKRFKELYANRNEYILYAYGDSHQDLELLNYADYPFYKCFQ